MADQRVGKTGEHARRFRQFASGLRGVCAIIDAGTEDFFGSWNHRLKYYLRQPAIGLLACRQSAHLLDRTRGKRVAQCGVSEALVHRHHAIAAQRAEQRLAVRNETQ